MNYNKQLEETVANQNDIIETLRKTNDNLVVRYNVLVEKYNTVACLLNACGIRETKFENGGVGWCVAMQIGDLPNPDPETFTEPVKPIKQDGDTVVWEVNPNT